MVLLRCSAIIVAYINKYRVVAGKQAGPINLLGATQQALPTPRGREGFVEATRNSSHRRKKCDGVLLAAMRTGIVAACYISSNCGSS